jgi:RNA polymerase sigma factor (sigma-70 family)
MASAKLEYRSDPKLVQACLDDDPRAWRELVDRYGRLVYSIPLEMGLGRADADDVFQNVFVILHRKLPNLRDHTRLSAWLITTTQRESWRWARRRQASAAEDVDEVEIDLPAPDHAESWEREQTVREAMDRLDDRCRDLLTALFLDPSEPSYEDVSRRLSLPVGSIGPTRARCFKKLEGIFEALGLDPIF